MRGGTRRIFMFVGFGLALASFGTAMSCGHEFGAPPERAFWCSDVQDIGKLFRPRVQEAPPPASVTCVKTLAEFDCYPNTTMAGG